jgi:hypothetical protein
MRPQISAALSVLLVLVLTGCGDSADGGEANGTENGATDTSGIDVCALLSDEELTSAIGIAPPKEASEPAGPFTGCSWGTGLLIVQIAPSETLIMAPGEDDCPSAGIGDESVSCPGRVKFLTNGIHVSVSTIEDITEDQMKAVATTLLPKLQD